MSRTARLSSHPHPRTGPRAVVPTRAGRVRLGLVIAVAVTAQLSGCAVASVAGAAAGAAISVTGAVVSTTVKVTGKVVEKTIDAVTPGSD